MPTLKYRTEGTCSQEIVITLEGGRVQAVEFVGGCEGNLQAVSALVRGRTAEEVVGLLRGIQCQNGTSCPDQLARALAKALARAAKR